MTTIFDSSAIVKPGTFGRGVLQSSPSDRLPVPLSDLEWAAMAFSLESSDFDVEPDWDEMATEAAALDSLESGLIPNDVAEHISRTSLVGHDDRGSACDPVEVYRSTVERMGGRTISRKQAETELGLEWLRLSTGR
jgi:hypothetical protein